MTPYGWCVVVVGLLGCAGSGVTAGERPNNQAVPAGSADYSLTQLSASQPERGGRKPDAKSEPLEVAPPAVPTQGCDAAECTGDLPAVALAQLRAAAAKSEDCYEKELKEHPQLEGKWTVLLRLTSDRAPGAKLCPMTIERAGFEASDAFRKCLFGVLEQTQAKSVNGCVDVALPLSFVRQEIEVPAATSEAGGAPSSSSPLSAGAAPSTRVPSSTIATSTNQRTAGPKPSR